MLAPADIRRLALELPDTVEADHFGMASFRVAKKILCTIHVDQPRMMVKLEAEDQHNLTVAHPGVIEPVPGAWGRHGSTFVWYEKADEALVRTLLWMAWTKVAPKKLVKASRLAM
jgi:hypothetical protein